MVVTDQKSKVLFIINGMVKNMGVVSVSGGDVRLLEILRNCGDDVEKHILTTPNGKEFFSKYPNITYKNMYIMNYNLGPGLLSNMGIVIRSLFYAGVKQRDFKNGIVYSSCEHLYDVFPALKYKLTKSCKWYAVYHWVEDYPWKEKRGNTPLISRYAYWLNRYIAGWLIKHFSDEVLAVSDPTKEKLLAMKRIKSDKVRAVYCGVNYDAIRGVVEKYRAEAGTRYDAVFMKRLNYGKGVFDLLRIWREVVKKEPGAKLGVIGDGSEEVIAKVNTYIKEYNLEKNIELLGVIYDFEEKFRIINSAKVFLLPTHEENWAIVIGEAMAAGIPVVASRLKEIVPIWGDNVIWCEVGEVTEFSRRVLEIIHDTPKSKALSRKALQFIHQYDWKVIGRQEFE